MVKKLSLYGYLCQERIDIDYIKKLTPMFTHREYKKGDIILNMGENTKVICLILQGIVRGYYIDEEGNEITKCFAKEGDWCCVYNMIKNSPSDFWIEALEDCQVEEIDVEQVRTALSMSKQLRNFYDKLYNEAFLQNDEKVVLFQKMQGKERYLYFINNYPELAERVKQEYIASYIGLTPSSLSRIKREL